MPLSLRLLLSALLLWQYSQAQKPDVFDRYLQKLMAGARIPGATLLVAKEGRVLKAAGYGYSNLELKTKAGPETVYELASISKPITGMAALSLVEAGKLALDSSLYFYLADAVPPSHSRITVRHLLNHTSGLPTDHFQYTKLYAPTPLRYTVAEQMRDLFKLPVAGRAGEVFHYSNANYFLLAALIEKLSGEPFARYVSRAVLEKAGMQNTSFLNGDSIVANRAQGYTLRKGTMVRFSLETILQALDANGFAGVRSNAADLLRLVQLFTDGKILHDTTVKAMLTLSRMKDGSEAGFSPGSKMALSWFVRPVAGHTTYSHSGYTGTVVVFVPEQKLTVVLLTNLGYGISLLGDKGFDAAEEGFKLMELALQRYGKK